MDTKLNYDPILNRLKPSEIFQLGGLCEDTITVIDSFLPEKSCPIGQSMQHAIAHLRHCIDRKHNKKNDIFEPFDQHSLKHILYMFITHGNIKAVELMRETFDLKPREHDYYGAANQKHNHMLDHLNEHYIPITKWQPSAMFKFIESGDVQSVKHWHEKGLNLSHSFDLCAFAAQHGQLDCLKYLHEVAGCPLYDCIQAALYKGHFEIVKYLETKKYNWSNIVSEALGQSGSLECLQLMREKNHDIDYETVATYAAMNGHVHLLQYLWNNGYSHVVTQLDLLCGSLECLQFVYDRSTESPRFIDPCAFEREAISNNSESIQWLLEKKISIPVCAPSTAAANGHFECLKLLIQSKRQPMKTEEKMEESSAWLEAMTQVAVLGRLDILKYLHELGYPWDEQVCSYAARGGQLECLKYAYEHGCPINLTFCCKSAIRSMNCLKYLLEHVATNKKHRIDLSSTELCLEACLQMDLECLKYLRARGWDWDIVECYEECASNGSFDIMLYMRNEIQSYSLPQLEQLLQKQKRKRDEECSGVNSSRTKRIRVKK